MAASLPLDFRLQPTPSLVRRAGRLEGGRPRVRVELGAAIAPVVDALLAGGALGSIASPDAEAAARRLLELDLATPRPAGETSRSLRVAAVVPARDAAASLPAALDGLAGLEEVIVVDDGSVDDTAQIAAGRGAKVLRRTEAGGPAAARNAGAAHTDADIVVFLDADTEAAPGWVEHLLTHFDDPVLGGAAPRVRSIEGSSALARYEAASGALDLGKVPALVRPDGRVTFVSTTALAVRRDAFLEVGGFAEDLRFGEDLDLVWRLWAARRPVVYEPSVEVRHRHRATLRAHLRNQYHYATASGPLSARHAGVPRAGRADPLVALGALAFLSGAHRTGAALALGGAARIGGSLAAARVPAMESALIAARSTLDGGRNIAAAVSRPWLPLALALAGLRRPARPGVGLAIVSRWLVLSRREAPASDRMSWLAMRALEDTVHSVGVAAGCVSARRVAPLLPGRIHGPEATSSVLGHELRLP